MVSSAFYPGLIIGGLAGAITLRILRYKAIKGGEVYDKVRYPREEGDDRERTTEGIHSTGSEGFDGKVVSTIELPREQDVDRSVHIRREPMETPHSGNGSKDLGTKPSSFREALRNRIRNRKGGN